MEKPSADRLDGDDEVDTLIAVHQELTRHAETRRQRADATGATLMTTAVALGAALVAAANALTHAEQIPRTAAWVTLVSLALTLVLGAGSRASVLQKLSSSTRQLWDQEAELVRELRTRAERAAGAADGGHPPQPQHHSPSPADPGTRRAKQSALLLWRTTAENGHRTVKFKNRLLIGGGVSLAVALAMLVYIGFSILQDAYA